MEVNFIDVVNGEKDFSGVAKGDVVILFVFGVSVEEMQLFNDWECIIVDIMCFWVFKVWNLVEKYKKKEYIFIIYGKYNYEEIIVISFFVGIYLIVLNMVEV